MKEKIKEQFVVVSLLDNEDIGKFDTLEEAKECVKNCIEFDKRNNNLFNEVYFIEIRNGRWDK